MPEGCSSFAGLKEKGASWEAFDARPLLPKAAFFMGDLRDGLPMLNMQAAFLVSAKNFSEKQVGILFLAFGLAQFVCMTPAGYFLDYSNNKIDWVIWSGAITSILTVTTAVIAHPGGNNLGLMVLIKILQGGISAILPPAFNSVTLGIVGGSGFTFQVSRNRMMNHVGTALIVAIGSLISYLLYPNIGALFIVSPLAMIGVYYNMVRIKPAHVDKDAARALIVESSTMTEYEHLETQNSLVSQIPIEQEDGSDEVSSSRSHYSKGSPLTDTYSPSQGSREATIKNNINNKTEEEALPLHHEMTPSIPDNAVKFQDTPLSPKNDQETSEHSRNKKYDSSIPSFNLGWGNQRQRSDSSSKSDDPVTVSPRARTPLAVLRDPTLLAFTFVLFTFHLSNSSVLPLVMQSLTIEDERSGILLSGMCILIGQGFMSWFAKICGDYSPKWGRKGLTLAALSSLTVRCFLLTLLATAAEDVKTEMSAIVVKGLILSTQMLDSVGAGIFGTMHILITNDISCRTGRFSLMMGATTGAMCLGATISGYVGQAIAEDYGYAIAFTSLGIMSLVPLFLFAFCMPETLPDYVKPEQRKRRLMIILKKINDQRRKLAAKATNHFRRRRDQQVSMELQDRKEESLIEKPSPEKEFV
ncbi:major facilitator superfamily transporter [Nitzschia inconspicua]|uniref:Major facilitator superfamily transporter n=1 Tax=Nitzschia inconspicua TaxID=303405 RepID=A0A9K3LE03_9STRA|nr:major facilitator superfamily transporter [Nitzschia inconspicua]